MKNLSTVLVLLFIPVRLLAAELAGKIVPELTAADIAGPTVFGLIFIFMMSLLREPARQQFNAIFAAGAGSAYLNGGLGGLEFLYITAATIVAYKGLRSYKYIGIAWLMHAGWDIVHHLYATPIWPWLETSSAGCAIFDTVIAAWFLIGAPSIYTYLKNILNPVKT